MTEVGFKCLKGYCILQEILRNEKFKVLLMDYQNITTNLTHLYLKPGLYNISTLYKINSGFITTPENGLSKFLFGQF